MRPRNFGLLVGVLLFLGWQAWERRAPSPGAAAPAATTSTFPETRPAPSPRARPPAPAGVGDAGDTRDGARERRDGGADGVPDDVARVLASIRAGGPFPYERDGVVFGNFERRLPQRPRGWYHEYTVATPGERGRGARRIVAGGQPPSEFWYTGDHYETFSRIEAGAAR